MGSRYGGLKQVDPVGPNGETLLDYSVYDAARAGFGQAVFVIRTDFAETFRQTIGERQRKHLGVAYAYQAVDDLPAGFAAPSGRSKPWGTAHAVWAARDAVDTPFAVINADDFYGADAYRRIAGAFARFDDAERPLPSAMVGYRLENTLSPHGAVNRGICRVSDDGALRAVREYTGIAEGDAGSELIGADAQGARVEFARDALASMNFWGFTPAFFDALEERLSAFLAERRDADRAEYHLPSAVGELIEQGRLRCETLATGDAWFGVTYPEDKAAVQQAIRRRIEAGDYPERLH